MNINDIFKKAENSLLQNNLAEAKKSFLKIQKKIPNHIETLNNLALIEIKLGNKSNALKFFEKSLIFNSNQPQILSNAALCKHEMLDSSAAIINLDKAIKIDPTNSLFYFNRGKIFSDLHDFEKAEIDYLKTIELNQSFYQAYLNLGVIYNKQYRYKDACKTLEDLLKVRPNLAEGYYNLGISYDNNRNYEKALINYKKTIELDSNNYLAKYNLSCLCLHQKNFSEGWKFFEHRWAQRNKPDFIRDIPQCMNLDNLNKTLIWGEQGIGDQILLSSMLIDLNLEKKVNVAIDHKLIDLYRRSFPNYNFIHLDKTISLENFSYQIPFGGLGQFLRTNKDSFKKNDKFLKANEDEIKKIKKGFSDKSKKICGLSWRSKNLNTGNAKSIDLDQFIPILNNKNFIFVDLQYGDTSEEISFIENKFGIKIHSINTLDKFNDIDGLASLISACDLVISVSNVTAHLAGALGIKTFLLAPYTLGLIYYWHDGKTNLWYPSLQVFRQKDPNNWRPTLEDISKIL